MEKRKIPGKLYRLPANVNGDNFWVDSLPVDYSARIPLGNGPVMFIRDVRNGGWVQEIYLLRERLVQIEAGIMVEL